MMFDSLALVSFWPFCCNMSATLPGPIALYASSAQTHGEAMPDHRGASASDQPPAPEAAAEEIAAAAVHAAHAP